MSYKMKMRFEGTYQCDAVDETDAETIARQAKNRLETIKNALNPEGTVDYRQDARLGSTVTLNVDMRIPIVVDEGIIDPELSDSDKEDQRDIQRFQQLRILSRRMRDEGGNLPSRTSWRIFSDIEEIEEVEEVEE